MAYKKIRERARVNLILAKDLYDKVASASEVYDISMNAIINLLIRRHISELTESLEYKVTTGVIKSVEQLIEESK